jgi:DNA-binding CsgD family transcriptional regulator
MQSTVRGQLWRLTPRETEVLAEMAVGRTNAAIGEVLFISRKAVEKHVNSIFSKFLLSSDRGLHPRVHAVLIYLVHRQSGSDTDATGQERQGSGPRTVSGVPIDTRPATDHGRRHRGEAGSGSRQRPSSGCRHRGRERVQAG